MSARSRGIGLAILGLGFLGAATGCRSDRGRAAGQTQDRVHVDVPFVNVRVGEHGGAKVDAPFTHVETPRYQQQSGTAPIQAVPASPVSSSSQYTPAPSSAPRRIAPAVGTGP